MSLGNLSKGGLNTCRNTVFFSVLAGLTLAADVEAQLFQTAYADVLSGRGHYRSAWLVKEAWRNVRGEWGQRGSDHPRFREQNGQIKYASAVD